jgi:hypothetical protein
MPKYQRVKLAKEKCLSENWEIYQILKIRSCYFWQD